MENLHGIKRVRGTNQKAKKPILINNLKSIINKIDEIKQPEKKKFRDKAKDYAWKEFDGKYVAIDCSTDDILPAWAPLLIASYLNTFAKEVIFGDLKMLENHLFKQVIDDLNLDQYKNKPIIIKGCSEKEIPENAFIQLLARFQLVAKSIFYGEACSSVPIWKKAQTKIH